MNHIPLPPPEKPGFAATAADAAARVAGWMKFPLSWLRMRLGFLKWRVTAWMERHRRLLRSLKFGAYLCTVLLLLMTIVGLVYLTKAYRYDLNEVAHVRGGADVVDWTGCDIGRIVPKNRKIVTLEDVPPHLIDALLATEDERFYQHEGYDFWGIARASVANLRARRIRQGASTITQQLARNACALTERSYDRKITEIFLAWRIERAYSKSEILVGYLNRIYLGSGFWGIGAAAEGYFSKNVADLDLGESAMLCGIIKSPNPSSPFRDYERAAAARDDTLNRMVRSGLLDPADRDEWQKRRTVVRRFDRTDLASPYVLAQIGREAHGLLARDSLEGLVVETSLDTRLQRQVEAVVETTLREIEQTPDYAHPTREEFLAGEPDKDGGVPYLQAAVLVLQNATGEVVAAVGTRNHRESEHDRVWRSKRPAGSSFLPLLYAAAFENPEISPRTPVFDAPLANREVMIGGQTGILGEWCAESPENRFEGKIPAAWAFLRGKTSASVRLGFATGLPQMHHVVNRAGIHSKLRRYPSSFLGSSEVNLAELTHAFTIYPNLGWRSSRSGLIRKITTTGGKPVYDGLQNSKPVRVVSPMTATQLNVLMNGAMTAGGVQKAVEGQISGKGGVSYEGTDHWFVGFNSRFTWGVWVGFDLPAKISGQLRSNDTAFNLWARLAPTLDTAEPLMSPPGVEIAAICEKNCPNCENPDHAKVSCPFPATVRAVPIAEANTEQEQQEEREEEPKKVAAAPKVVPVKVSMPPLVGDDPYGALGAVKAR